MIRSSLLDKLMKLAVLVIIIVELAAVQYFIPDFYQTLFRLTLDGNVEGLTEYISSFGYGAIAITIFMIVLTNMTGLPSIPFLTVNGVIFGLLPGIGNGTGTDTGSNNTAQTGTAETTAPPQVSETTAVEVKVTAVEVTVKENSYVLNGNTMEIDALIAELEKNENGVNVTIIDDNASLDAYNNLTAALDEKNIPYSKQ